MVTLLSLHLLIIEWMRGQPKVVGHHLQDQQVNYDANCHNTKTT
jgi:hypothetical protein